MSLIVNFALINENSSSKKQVGVNFRLGLATLQDSFKLEDIKTLNYEV